MKVININTEFENSLSRYKKRINNLLLKYLKTSTKKTPKRFAKAIQYSVLNGGKRLRPILVYVVGEMYGADLKSLDIPACAIELIHSFSLVHDDLPAMDNDSLRRGMPTCHIMFDEATAILAGDVLMIAPFQIISEAKTLSLKQKVTMIKVLSTASGPLGMASGQYIDLHGANKKINEGGLQKMYLLKTGALIQAAVKLGALAANVADKKTWQCLDEYAKNIGLAFQIQDDILNVESTEKRLGKNVGTDRLHNKITYPDLVGMTKAKAKVKFLWRKAENALQKLTGKKTILSALTRYIMERDF